MKKTKLVHGLFLTNLDIVEQLFSVSVAEREALLIRLAKENKAAYLGHTDKSAPELATECIKKGIKAQSFVKGKALDNNKNP
jgi:hypothetical protein